MKNMKKHVVVFCVRNSKADMIDLERLKPVLEGYKAYFSSHWDDEKYKWEAIKHFQDHWDIDAENFGDMFKQATDKTFNLLASGYAYPRGRLYEKFILEYYRQDHTYLSEIKAGQVKWYLVGDNSESIMRFLPVMQTDIMLQLKERY